jgi:predicted CXXCH cytochrome family protein
MSRNRLVAAFVVLVATAIVASVKAENRARVTLAYVGSGAERSILRSSAQELPDNRCQHCHEPDPLFSHPVDVIPTMHVPSNLPLENGRMTCMTCHDGDSDLHGAARTLHTGLLRDSSAQNFCNLCHSPNETTRAAQHGSAIGRAHLMWPGKRDSRSALADGFDAETQNCLTCHDGLMSQDIALSRHARADQRLSEHPIGVRLAATGSASPFQLRSPGSIDHRIRLLDNQVVGCTTCHSPFSREAKLLVMPNDRSRLCLSCHNE